MPAYPFLSDEWFVAVREVVAGHQVDVPVGAPVAVNVVVTDTPFGEDRRLHVATHDGVTDWSTDLLDEADLTVTTDYATARELFLSGDQQLALAAFFAGKVKLQGDFTKVMAAQAGGGIPGVSGLADQLAAVTL